MENNNLGICGCTEECATPRTGGKLATQIDISLAIQGACKDEEPPQPDPFVNRFVFSANPVSEPDLASAIGQPVQNYQVAGNTVTFDNANYVLAENGIGAFLNTVSVVSYALSLDFGSFAGYNDLISVDLPICTTAADYAFYQNPLLTSIITPQLTNAGNHFITGNASLELVELPALETTGNNFLFYTGIPCALKNVNLPALKSTGATFCGGAASDITLYAPVLESIGSTTLSNGGFSGVIGRNWDVTLNAFLQTANAGAVEGDIKYLLDNNNVTVNWV